jgi:hypothetical protein
MGNIAKEVVLGLAIACLTACAQALWDKPGATQQDFATDSYGCERDARQSGYFGGGIIGAINFQNFYERCLVARGYRKIQNDASSTETMTSSRDLSLQAQRSSPPTNPPLAPLQPVVPQREQLRPVASLQPAVPQQQRKVKLEVVQPILSTPSW